MRSDKQLAIDAAFVRAFEATLWHDSALTPERAREVLSVIWKNLNLHASDRAYRQAREIEDEARLEYELARRDA